MTSEMTPFSAAAAAAAPRGVRLSWRTIFCTDWAVESALRRKTSLSPSPSLFSGSSCLIFVSPSSGCLRGEKRYCAKPVTYSGGDLQVLVCTARRAPEEIHLAMALHHRGPNFADLGIVVLQKIHPLREQTGMRCSLVKEARVHFLVSKVIGCIRGEKGTIATVASWLSTVTRSTTKPKCSPQIIHKKLPTLDYPGDQQILPKWRGWVG